MLKSLIKRSEVILGKSESTNEALELANEYRRRLNDHVILSDYQTSILIKVDDPQIRISEHKYIQRPYASALNLNLSSNIKHQYNKV